MFLIVSFALLALQHSARAPDVLELKDVYREAQQQNQRIVASRALASAARARVQIAKLPPDPQLQFGFMNYSVPRLAPMDVLGMRQIQLMQMIPLAGKLGLAGRSADAQANAAVERSRDVEWSVRSEVAMAFYDIYATDRALEVSRQTLRLLQDTRAIAEGMYRVGEAKQADVLRAQVEIARMAEDTLRMTTMRTGMAARLSAVLNHDANAGVSTPALPRFPRTLPSLDALLAQSVSNRPMLRAGQYDVEAAIAQTRLAGREKWPDLSVGLQYGRQGSEMGTQQMGSLMIGALLPIFGRQSRMREESRAMQQMSEADLAAMRAQTRADVTTGYANLTRARNLAALYRNTIIPQAEAAASSAQAAYRAGGVDFMTLLDDRMTVNKYKQELFALEAEEGKAWADLEMMLGRELLIL